MGTNSNVVEKRCFYPVFTVVFENQHEFFQKVNFGVLGLLILAFQGRCGSVENFTKTVRYTAPTNFSMIDYSGDYSVPFSIGGSSIECDPTLANDPNSKIRFELAMACYSFGEHGSGIKFLSTAPPDLKRDFESFYGGVLTNLPPAKIGKVSGLTAVSSSILIKQEVLGTCYFYANWIQIKTNIVVKVTVESCDAKTFTALTNSLRFLKVDKKGILDVVASQKQISLPFPRLM